MRYGILNKKEGNILSPLSELPLLDYLQIIGVY